MVRLFRMLVLPIALLVSGTMAEARVVLIYTSFYKVVTAGQRIKLDTLVSLDPTCHSLGQAQVTLKAQPRGGQVEIAHEPGFPSFGRNNVRFACDTRRVPSTTVYYHADRAFVGEDNFTVESVFPDGNARMTRYFVSVR